MRIGTRGLARTGARALGTGLLVCLLAACGDAARDEATGEVTEAGDVDVSDVAVGDCLTSLAGEEQQEVSRVRVVPCSEEHEDEVYAEFTVPGGDEYPGQESVLEVADQGCLDRFAEFVGLGYEESELEINYLYPTEESWGNGDRVVQCTVYDPAGPVAGSLQAAER